MSHAYALVPNFATPAAAPPLCVEQRLPFHADPILAAIEAHEETYAVFQVAPEGEPSLRAEEAYDAATDALLATPCATRQGAFCLLRHLRWWLAEESAFADHDRPAYAIALAREADLTLLLGCDGLHRIPVALPLGRLASVPVHPVAGPVVIDAGPAPAPALVRLGRAVTAAGEVAAALLLIVGGCGGVGLASLL